MKDTPFSRSLVHRELSALHIQDPGTASIRDIRRLTDSLEQRAGKPFVRMEMGIPGLSPPEVALQGEITALTEGVAASYPPIAGVPRLKTEISRFVRLFMDISVPAECCVPTVGSINGCYAAFMAAGRRDRDRAAVLFMDPGFPVHKQLARLIGLDQTSFDMYGFRGAKLEDKLRSMLDSRRVGLIVYSNPNNPAWICLNEQELAVVGRLADDYDVVVLEDLAYFGMDFRRDISVPGEAPFQPTVARYCDNYMLAISTSKAFSYAGQRIAMLAISANLFHRSFPDLGRFYDRTELGAALVYGTMYATTAGVTHSTQYGLLALLQAVNSGKLDFISPLHAYRDRAKRMKELFLANGFHLVYDRDLTEPIADGFYFTIAYPGMSGTELVSELLPYGISAISLATTGSERTEGLRACVSLVHPEHMELLAQRLALFHAHHPLP